jgi:hypothetical protein
MKYGGKMKEIYRVGENEMKYDGGIVVKKFQRKKIRAKLLLANLRQFFQISKKKIAS